MQEILEVPRRHLPTVKVLGDVLAAEQLHADHREDEHDDDEDDGDVGDRRHRGGDDGQERAHRRPRLSEF